MIRTFFHPKLVMPEGDWAPSLGKGAEVLAALGLSRGYTRATKAFSNSLCRVHDLDYVDGVLERQMANGFNDMRQQTVDSLSASVGVMVDAVRWALDRPEEVVFAPVSGFHHAQYEEAAGFCTFNGLLVAIAEARLKRRVPSVLILDGDAHYGDGTDALLTQLGWAGVYNLTHERPKSVGPGALDRNIWRQQIRGLLTNREWDLVLYQAGADAHVDDPYAAGYLTDSDWDERDELVFGLCRAQRFPCVFNLAGGYNGEKTVQLHARTYRTAERVYEG